MWPQEFTWFFAIFHHEFRKGNLIAFEVLMTLAFAHFFGFYNPKQLADRLEGQTGLKANRGMITRRALGDFRKRSYCVRVGMLR